MALAEQLQQDMKEAMRAKDTLRLNAIRLLRATLQAEGNGKRQRTLDAWVKEHGVSLADADPTSLPPAEPLTEAESLQIIAREVKKRQDSIEAFTAAGRPELADAEQKEIDIINQYLPAQLTTQELRPMVQSIISELGAQGKADMKKVMPVVMTRLRDRADGRTLNQLVGELLH
ncbi:MAG: GatB/YqeY domain-containing protein [Herpetosiphon sp.]